jgi:PAS domain S-box-containing protein
MWQFFQKLFATDFMAHVYCLRLPEVVWLHVTSDVLIAISYFAIPLTLVLLVKRRNDLVFSWMFMLFGLFILACGATHLLSVWTLWHPMYRLEGVVKAITALVSMPTAVLLFRLLPQVSALPSPAQLRAEISERKAAEERTWRLNASLEQIVKERTAALELSNKRLKESEARFRAAAQAATNIIWTTDSNGQMYGEQPEWAAFTGQSQADYQGFGWSAKIHPDDVNATLSEWRRAVAERGEFHMEHRVAREDGQWRLCKVVALPIRGANGSVLEWVGTHTDITEQREAEQEALRARIAAETANRAKSSFLASISHELRTPLNAIIGYSELMEEELQEAGLTPFLSDLLKVRNSSRHLLELIDALLDLRKIEAGRMDLYLEDFAIGELAAEIAETARPLMQKNGNAFSLRIAPNLGIMHSDATKIRQSVLNVLSNAAKFTEKGTITFCVDADGSDIVLQVTDSGIGIENDQVEKLFQPFTQADPSTRRLYGGTGLGLALTRRFCRLMGGDITWSKPAHGKSGSTFTIRIPRRLPGPVSGDGAAYGEFRAELSFYAESMMNQAQS